MKRLSAILLVFLLLLSGCGSGGRSLGISEEEITDTDILRMKITDFSSEDITLEFINDSKSFIQYGEEYTLEFREEGEWHILRPKSEPAFIEVAYVLEQETSCTWGTDLTAVYGALPAGNYRIIKHFTVHKSEMDMGEPVTIAAAFLIK